LAINMEQLLTLMML